VRNLVTTLQDYSERLKTMQQTLTLARQLTTSSLAADGYRNGDIGLAEMLQAITARSPPRFLGTISTPSWGTLAARCAGSRKSRSTTSKWRAGGRTLRDVHERGQRRGSGVEAGIRVHGFHRPVPRRSLVLASALSAWRVAAEVRRRRLRWPAHPRRPGVRRAGAAVPADWRIYNGADCNAGGVTVVKLNLRGADGTGLGQQLHPDTSHRARGRC